MNEITARLCRQLAENADTTVAFKAMIRCKTRSQARHIAETLAVDFGTVARDRRIGNEPAYIVVWSDFVATVYYQVDDDE